MSEHRAESSPDDAEADSPRAEPLTLVVPDGHPAERADRLLVELLASAGHTVARAELQRWLEAGAATRGGQRLEKRTTLRPGDRVVLEHTPAAPSDAVPDSSVVFEVVYEDPHLVVVDKPAGLVVHPARGHRDGTLVNGLLARGGFERAAADPRDPDGHLRPGIVHRLDKDTSGLLVVAKDPLTREGLKRLFAEHDIERAYLALTSGDTQRASFDTPHGRHPRNRLKFTSQLPADRERIKRAITHVQPLKQLSNGRATLVRCTLETGRTHQIRVHLAERARTPILADALYGSPPADPRVADVASALGRQALHAAVLGFRHPITGEALQWESPMPADFAAALAELESMTSE